MQADEVRRAVPDDAEQLWRLNGAFNGPGLSSPQRMRALLANRGSEIVFVSERDGALTGFCCGQLCATVCYDWLCGEVTELFVSPEYRRQGLGRRLVETVEESMRDGGAKEIKLLTSHRNGGAGALYESLGYERENWAVYAKDFVGT